jgi:hypothetical protein
LITVLTPIAFKVAYPREIYRRIDCALRYVIHPERTKRRTPRRKGGRENPEGTPFPNPIFFHSRM